MKEISSYPEEAVLVGAAQSIWNGSDAKINIGIDVSPKLVQEMLPYLENELELVFITDSDMRHIKRQHGIDDEKRGQITIQPEDFAFLPAVLNDFDLCEHTETDKLGNKKFLLSKALDDVVYVVTIQRGKRKLEVKTMWKKRMSGASC